MLEQQHGESFARWLTYLQDCWFTHIPNETGSSPEAKRRAVRMKQAGTSPGFPDYLIFIKRNGIMHLIAIELKKDTKSKASVTQKAWLKILAMFGFKCAVCHGWGEAKEFVESIIGKEVVEF